MPAPKPGPRPRRGRALEAAQRACRGAVAIADRRGDPAAIRSVLASLTAPTDPLAARVQAKLVAEITKLLAEAEAPATPTPAAATTDAPAAATPRPAPTATAWTTRIKDLLT